MLAFFAEWSNLLLRWFHLVVGIGWIGTSFYFIALDLRLRKRPQMDPALYGGAWLVHGGGFYNVEKYTLAPASLPDDLIWYKWDAYLTFISGFLLLTVMYYFNAEAYLIDRSVLPLTQGEAIVISVASLAAGWAIYHWLLCKGPIGDSAPLLALAVFVMIMAFAYLFTHVYSGRGAFIHVGALVGSIMAINVFMVIIPNQRRAVESLVRGEVPDPALGRTAKQRSVHNNYLTLPVLVMMVSNHYPILTNHPESWILAGLILVMGAMARHFLNRHEAGDPFEKIWWTLPVAAAALVAALVMTSPAPRDPALAAVTDAEVLRIAATHCATCHSAQPTHEGFAEAPKGVMLTELADIRRYAALIDQQAVKSDAMPLGNETGMSDAERAALGAWIARQ